MRPDVLPNAPVDVLIADDDAQLRGCVRLLLEAQGFTCAEAADGPQAVAVARKLAPRCVLLDLGMPGLDGFAVARRLRMDPRTAHAHVHCLTGRADPVSRQQAEEAGCELFLTKPVDPSAVVAAVGGWTGLTRSAAENLLDMLEAHGYGPAAVTYEEGVGFAVRVPELNGTADGEDTVHACSRRGAARTLARSVHKPVPGRRARYVGVHRPHGVVGSVAVRVPRVPTLVTCAIGACGLLAAFWFGVLPLFEVGVFAALLAVLLAVPSEERWLASFPPDFQHDPNDNGGIIEFEGIVTERGRYGHKGTLCRRVEIVRVVRYDRDNCWLSRQ